MKKFSRYAAATIWIVTGALLFGHYWLVTPGAFPPIPQPVARWLVDAYGAKNAEEIGNLEELTALFLGLVFTSLVTWLAVKTWRRLKARKSST